MQHHPDRNPGDAAAEERFKEASEAYAVLADGDKRAAYDRFGHAGVSSNGGGGFDETVFHDFHDILGDFFGFDIFGGRGGAGGQRRTRVQRGADLREDLKLEFEEAVFGADKTVTVRRHETCEACRGAGTAPGKSPVTCRTCNGHGQVRHQQGFFSIARTCSTCQGLGQVITDPCLKCKGEGRILRQRTVEANVPAGVEDGTRIRFSGAGEVGAFGGPAGDLIVVTIEKLEPKSDTGTSASVMTPNSIVRGRDITFGDITPTFVMPPTVATSLERIANDEDTIVSNLPKP